MQETQYQGKKHQEFFTGKTDEETIEKMARRMHELRAQAHTPVRRVKIGRNDPCPCGSGKKFKKCHIDQVR